jgi:hypothetical protein
MTRAALLALLALGCGMDIELLDRDGGGPGGGDLGACSNAPIHIGSSAPSGCAASLAAALLRHAICTCEALPGGPITTEAFDSTGTPVPADRAAAVGTNGEGQSSLAVNIGGSLALGGSGQAPSAWRIAESLRADGDLTAAAPVTVAGDAWVTGNLDGPITIAGTLHQPEGRSRSGGVVVGKLVEEQVSLEEPCPCDNDHTVPVAVVVAAHAGSNDDGAIGLKPGDLAGVSAPATRTLPCGEYYLTSIGTSADLTLRVQGRVALHVDGPVKLGGSLVVQLDPDAELDLLVAGGFSTAGGTIGDPAHAARVRLWLSPNNKVALGGDPTVGAAIYALGCELSAPAGAHLSGAALAGRLTLGGELRVRYDRALLSAGNLACGTPVQPPIP